MPLVSICLPTLNARKFLEPRVETLLGQTLADWELIVCDSYSDDGTWEFLQRLKDDKRVRLHQVPREGVYAGWNECLKRATGNYVYIATADDTCEATLLEKMVAALEKKRSSAKYAKYAKQGDREASGDGDPPSPGGLRRTSQSSVISDQSGEDAKKEGEDKSFTEGNKGNEGKEGKKDNEGGRDCRGRVCDIAVCEFDFIDEEGRVMDPRPRGVPGDFYAEWNGRTHVRSGLMELLVHSYLGVSWTTITSVVFRRRLLDSTGLFRADVGVYADRIWAMRSALASDTMFVPGRLATWRVHPGQRSHGEHPSLMKGVVSEIESVLRSRENDCGLFGISFRDDGINRLMWGIRRQYYEMFHLDRDVMRRDPWRFLRTAAAAACADPMYLLHRVRCGFSWNDAMLADEKAALRELIKEWDVAMPVVE